MPRLPKIKMDFDEDGFSEMDENWSVDLPKFDEKLPKLGDTFPELKLPDLEGELKLDNKWPK